MSITIAVINVSTADVNNRNRFGDIKDLLQSSQVVCLQGITPQFLDNLQTYLTTKYIVSWFNANVAFVRHATLRGKSDFVSGKPSFAALKVNLRGRYVIIANIGDTENLPFITYTKPNVVIHKGIDCNKCEIISQSTTSDFRIYSIKLPVS